MFQKIFRYMQLLLACALFLVVVLILCLLYALLEPTRTYFITLAILTYLAAFLVYLVFSRIARAATKDITEPLERLADKNFSLSENTYEELKPLLSRLTTQTSEIKRQSDKAKSQKLQLQTITANMNEGLIVLDSSLNVLSINRCACDIFHLPEREMKDKSIHCIPESGMFSKGLNAACEGKNSDLIFFSGGKTYQIYFTPVLEKEKISGVVILLFDVSQRQRAEQVRREFSANVSHELKTPLTTISGYSQIITNGIAKPEDVKGFAEKIEKETSRLITLIDDIIALSALEENGSEVEKETVDIKEVAEEVLDSLEIRAREQNITLDITGDSTTISANRRQMTELIYNLCNNAVKYNKPGGSVTVNIARIPFPYPIPVSVSRLTALIVCLNGFTA